MNAPAAAGRTAILSASQKSALCEALAGKPLALCFGAGVDSTAMLVALHEAGIRPDVITFADTRAEKCATYEHIERVNEVLRAWEWPTVDVCRKIPKASTGYVDLYGNCMANETLPSLAFGMKSCSELEAGTPGPFSRARRPGPARGLRTRCGPPRRPQACGSPS